MTSREPGDHQSTRRSRDRAMLHTWLLLFVATNIAFVTLRPAMIEGQPRRPHIPGSGENERFGELVVDFQDFAHCNTVTTPRARDTQRILLLGSSVVANYLFRAQLEQELIAKGLGEIEVQSMAFVGASLPDQLRLLRLTDGADYDLLVWLLVPNDLERSRLTGRMPSPDEIEDIAYGKSLRQSIANYRFGDDIEARYLSRDVANQLLPWRPGVIRLHRSWNSWPVGQGDTWSESVSDLFVWPILAKWAGREPMRERRATRRGTNSFKKVELRYIQALLDDVQSRVTADGKRMALGILGVPFPDEYYSDGTGDQFRFELEQWCRQNGTLYINCPPGQEESYSDYLGHLKEAEYRRLVSAVADQLVSGVRQGLSAEESLPSLPELRRD